MQLLRRVKGEEEYTLIGGILRFSTMAAVVKGHLKCEVNVPEPEMVQFVSALGAAILGDLRLTKIRAEKAVAAT